MPTRDKPPEKGRGKGAGKGVVSEAAGAANATPMKRFKALSKSVLSVSREEVLAEEEREKRRKD